MELCAINTPLSKDLSGKFVKCVENIKRNVCHRAEFIHFVAHNTHVNNNVVCSLLILTSDWFIECEQWIREENAAEKNR